MILSTHFVVGATLASLTNSPELLVVFPVIFHFLFDSLPHWEYVNEIKELQKKPFLLGLDIIIGPLLVFLSLISLNEASFSNVAWMFSGGIFGVLPDGIVLMGYLFFPKNKIFIKYDSFHRFFHSEKKLKPSIGIIFQFFIVSLSIILLVVAKSVEMR